MLEYYHVLVVIGDPKTGMDHVRCYDHDINNSQDVLQDYIIPFLKGKDFFIDGRPVTKENILQFLVKRSDKSLEEIYQWNLSHGSGGLDFCFDKDRLLREDDCVTDVTNEFIRMAKRLIEKETVRKPSVLEPSRLSEDAFSKVFIVHGRDNAAKQEVARFIEKLGIQAIILNELSNDGMTIIEKIEQYTDVGFGIVLYTPCDEGRLLGSDDLKPRARQNVVFEHGFLIGKIGRERVHALKKGNVEPPNDISGVVYTTLDENGGWKLKIAKEMKDCGYQIDMNKIDE